MEERQVKVAARPARNWSRYNQALCQRGDLTIWISPEVLAAWYHENSNAKPGAQYVYSDLAIVCALTLRAIYQLPLRQTVGLIRSIFKFLGLKLSVPCYTTLCRRAAGLTIELPCSQRPKHIVIDSTGLKVYGEGEWKVRMHGVGKRRTWRKLHLAVNPENHEVIASALTTNDVHDVEVFDGLFQNEEALAAVYADGAYDAMAVYDTISEMGAEAKIPPREGAVISEEQGAGINLRNENIRQIQAHGKGTWKAQSGYHTRSLAETAMFRVKTIFGSSLRSRKFGNQVTEAFARVRALNIMTSLGMPSAPKYQF